jgi:asparagine synthase (glutamine-hydrolysing)
LAKKYLPESFINQPKRGFEIPLRQWIDGPLKAPVSDLLSGNSYVSQYLQLGAIQDLFNNKIKIPPEKRAKMLWALMSVEIWHNSLKG